MRTRLMRALTAALVGAVLVAGILLPASEAGAAPPTTWHQVSPSASPGARGGAVAAYDSATGQLILFGGADSSRTALSDTWLWSGEAWRQLSPAASPPASDDASMAYDPTMRQLVLFGGVGGRGNHGDTWSWDGTTWHLLSPATSPSARWGAVMASDPATGHVVLFGGADESSGRLLSDTWIWNGSTWSQAAPTTSPQARYFSAFALDPASGRAVLFGGLAVPGSFGDTWAWDGVNWTQLAPLTSPSARYQASMTFDPYTRNIVLFGGGGPSGYLGDTWTWTGTTWAREAPAASPPPRLGASMAYDPTAAALVLFGGRGGDGSLVADTWLWGPTNPPVTGTVSGSPTFAGGSWVISEARISGSVTVSSGANVLIVNSTINGSLNANGSGSISVCGTTVGGTASISGARGFVLLGDPGDDACAANRLHGVTLSSNHGGLEVSGGNQIAGSLSVTGTTGSGPYPGDDRAEIEGNNMSGSLSCSGNSPAATNHGNTNTVHGSRNGECVGF